MIKKLKEINNSNNLSLAIYKEKDTNKIVVYDFSCNFGGLCQDLFSFIKIIETQYNDLYVIEKHNGMGKIIIKKVNKKYAKKSI